MSGAGGERFSDKDARGVRCLARFAEPWHVAADGDSFTVCDASGLVLLRLWHRQAPPDANTALTEGEAHELARLIARLPTLARRPQY